MTERSDRPAASAATSASAASFRGWWAPADDHGIAFECSSQGDIVEGRLRLAPASGGDAPAPLLLACGASERDRDLLLEAAAAAGGAFAAIDLPLEGSRTSVKLSERVLGAVGDTAADAFGAGLARDWERQSRDDLGAALDWLTAHPAIDGSRVVLAAFGAGGAPARAIAASDARIRADIQIGSETGPAALVLAQLDADVVGRFLTEQWADGITNR